VGWLGARWMAKRGRGLHPGPGWLIVPAAGILGVAGYAVIESTGGLAAGIAGAAAGVVIALLLLLFVWQRSHPVVRGTAGVYALTGIPCSALDEMSDDTARGLLARWTILSSGPLTRVALVHAERDLAPVAGRAAAWLHGLQSDATEVHGTNGAAPAQSPPEPEPEPEPERTQWRSRWARPQATEAATAAPAAAPATVPRLVLVTTDVEDGELAQEDLIVLLARDGMRRSRLAEAAGRVEDASHRPDWVLLTRSDEALSDHPVAQPTNGSHS
jgi:hypothetical protein